MQTNKQYARNTPKSPGSKNDNTECTCKLVVIQIQGLYDSHARQGRQGACATHTRNNTSSSPHKAQDRQSRTRLGRQITTRYAMINNTQPKRTCQLVVVQNQVLHARHARHGRQGACATHTRKQHDIIVKWSAR
jgi:hypothetical protein